LPIAILGNHDELGAGRQRRGRKRGQQRRASLATCRRGAHDVDWSDRRLAKVADKVSSLDVIKSLIDHQVKVNAQLTAGSIIKSSCRAPTSEGSDGGPASKPRRQRRS
jgi:hypothetical protein